MMTISGGKHKNFQYEEVVEVINTNSALDGVCGNVLGCASRHITDMYIVGLKSPRNMEDGYLYSAFVMVEGNLQRKNKTQDAD